MKIDTKTISWKKIKGRKGTSVKHLQRDKKRNFQIDLMRLDPNLTFNQHSHPDIEWIYILKGGFSDHRGNFKRGDFILNKLGSIHTTKTGAEGAEFIVCWCGKVTY